jgi:hypothetical protein
MARERRKSRCRLGHSTLVSRVAVNIAQSCQATISGSDGPLRCDCLPGRFEVLERLLDVVFVEGVARGGEHVVLASAASLPVREEIREDDAAVRAFSNGISPRRAASRLVGRLTFSRSAACWVVSRVACGTTDTASPLCIASTILRSAR